MTLLESRPLRQLVFAGWLAALAAGQVLADVVATGDVTPAPLMPGDFVRVGTNTVGTLTIDQGSELTSSGALVGVGGIGNATVTGAGSGWTISGAIDVGGASSGVGRVSVLDGAQLQASQFFLAREDGSVGTATVSGVGSTLVATNGLAVSDPFSLGGNAKLVIEDGGVVESSSSSLDVGPLGEVELNDGTLLATRYENRGVIGGDGLLFQNAFEDFDNSGLLRVGPSQSLNVRAGALDSTGRVTVSSGELITSSELRNSGQVTLDAAVLRVGPTMNINNSQPTIENEGDLLAIGGLSDVYGGVFNGFDATIALTNDSTVRFFDDVASDGGVVSVFAGSRAIFLGDLSIIGGTLLADIAGQSTGSGFGIAEVVGELQLQGDIQLSLGTTTSPQAGDRFQLISAAGGIQQNGSLTLDNPPALPSGLAWELEVGANAVVASVVAGLAGDFNEDGVVNDADYATWRNGLGNQFTVGQLDDWRANYGASLAAASQATAVPEPSFAVVFLAALLSARQLRRGTGLL